MGIFVTFLNFLTPLLLSAAGPEPVTLETEKSREPFLEKLHEMKL